jgi:ubiquinone/menaquinone biosynthesis C-methylase UbiE
MSKMSSEQEESIASLSLHSEGHLKTQLQSTQHRIDIVSNWDIPMGAKVLELGCGQGDCTAVLAELVGPNGHITAVDPGPLNYGERRYCVS